MGKILLFSFLLLCFHSHAQIHLQGIVLDSVSNEPLPFVNISVKGTSVGTSSGLSGKFELTVESLPVKLLFSYVGYEKKEILITTPGSYKIHLKNSGIELTEALVFAGPNPALRIMKKVVDHSEKNHPEKNGSFSYISYNKMVFTIASDSAELAEKKSTAKDKGEKEMFGFFEKQHLFMSECISEKKFISQNHQKETILSSKVSGFSMPVLSLISTQFQSFHFYTDEISLADVKYVGPVSQHGLNHYDFVLKDTFLLEQDSVFAITFSPKNENGIHSMKGVLQIHSDGYAIYNVIAEPFQQTETGFGIKISQQYQKINGLRWFPKELNTKIIMYGSKVGDFPVIGIGSGKLTDINLQPDLSKKDFDELEVAFDKEMKNSGADLQKWRSDSLTEKEKETYRMIDSLGNAHHFDRKMLAMQSLFSGCVPIKFLDWDITKLMNYNDYEKFRLGLALRTNHRLSEHFSLGGYFAYGFGDKAWKYGTDLNLVFSKRKQMELNVSLNQDIDAASVISTFEKQRSLLANGYSALFLNRFDSVMKYEARFSFRALRHFKFNAFANYQFREAFADFRYVVPLNEFVSFLDEEYFLAETGLEIKMAIHEKFIETPFGYFSNGTKWPMVIFRYTKGWKGIRDSEYEYERFTLKTDYKISSLRFGTFRFSLAAGITTGNAPYHLLFNPAGTYKSIEKLTVYSMDGFETMRLNEFLFDQFASLHFGYRLPWPIVNGKKFKPLLSFTNSMVRGNFKNSQNHQNINPTLSDKLFIESGMVIDNLLKSGFSGFGIGFFYRWGDHQLPSFKENFAIKISLSVALS